MNTDSSLSRCCVCVVGGGGGAAERILRSRFARSTCKRSVARRTCSCSATKREGLLSIGFAIGAGFGAGFGGSALTTGAGGGSRTRGLETITGSSCGGGVFRVTR